MYQRKVDVDMLKAVQSVLADVSSVSPSSEQSLNRSSLRKSSCKYFTTGARYDVVVMGNRPSIKECMRNFKLFPKCTEMQYNSS